MDTPSSTQRLAVFGCGFWSHYQIPGWQELEGVEVVAVYNRSIAKAEVVARKFGIDRVYDDAARLLDEVENIDAVDIITAVDTHLRFAELAAAHGCDVVCQKPLASTYRDARRLVELCAAANVRLFVNENFRWQAPVRRVREVVDSGAIGRVFKGRVSFCSAFPVFRNQPFLAELEQFILTDVGSHILDVCRFLMGEARILFCRTQRVNPDIAGEDVANVLMEMDSGAHCCVELSYASRLEQEVFPQTLILLEGTEGSVKLEADHVVKVTTASGTVAEKVRPLLYDWVDPEYALVHSSIVDAQRDILAGLRGGRAETTGADNLRTVQLVHACYVSAASGRALDPATLLVDGCDAS